MARAKACFTSASSTLLLRLWFRGLMTVFESSRPRWLGRAPEVTAEVRHTVHVGADGCNGKFAATKLLEHELAQLVHRESSYSACQTTPALAKLAQTHAERQWGSRDEETMHSANERDCDGLRKQ